MADWKEMYLSLMRDTEKAIRILEKGQEKCEDMYLEGEDLLPSSEPEDAPAANAPEDAPANEPEEEPAANEPEEEP